MSKISPLAYIHPDAKIGENCEIGPFCYIDQNVEIGDNNTLMNSVTVLYGARIGNGNIIFPGAVISAVPQDLKFQGEDTLAIIGDNNKIRENVTINRGTAAQNRTKVGSNNLLMEGCHVAHDAVVGNGCIIGPTYEDTVIARTAKKLVLTAEEIVPSSYFSEDPNRASIPAVLTTAVVKAPGGAKPCAVSGCYDMDREELRAFLAEKDPDAALRAAGIERRKDA